MSHSPSKMFAKSARVNTATWNDPFVDDQPHFGEVAMALLPASLILATAAALLVVLI